jgi:hypothetical protein
MQLGIYKHSKTGNLYKAHFVAKHSETLEDLVVYEALYDEDADLRGTDADKRGNYSKYWVRPLKMWDEIVEVNGKKVPRFVFVKEK